MKRWAFVVSFVALLGVLAPATAYASVQASPVKRVPADRHSSVRKTPKPPKHDQVHRGGVDGAITLLQFISSRRLHDERRTNQETPQDSAAQVRASWDHAARRPGSSLTTRTIESLPPHQESTHLSI
jgi:hypothetical protein